MSRSGEQRRKKAKERPNASGGAIFPSRIKFPATEKELSRFADDWLSPAEGQITPEYDDPETDQPELSLDQPQ